MGGRRQPASTLGSAFQQGPLPSACPVFCCLLSGSQGSHPQCRPAPPRCRLLQDAHADVVLWSSWTSFFSNSFVSIVLVSRCRRAGWQVVACMQRSSSKCVFFPRAVGALRTRKFNAQQCLPARPPACRLLSAGFPHILRSAHPVCLPLQTPLLGHWSDLHGRKPFFLVAQVTGVK